jgi:hypothetical protein
MDKSLSRAAMRLQQSETAAYSGIPAESPLRVAPLIREVIRAATNQLMFETGLLRKNVESTAPCFAIRTRNFADLSLMKDALPREIWDLVFGMLATKDIQRLFSTCTVMKACLEKYVDKAEQQYEKTADKILGITNNHSYTDIQVGRKLAKFWAQHDFIKVSLSGCERKLKLLVSLGENKSIKLLHIEANKIAKHIDGEIFGSSIENLLDARIELDLANNNLWSDNDFKQVFYSVVTSHSVSRINLDANNFKGIERSTAFFHMLFSAGSRISDLSLAGTNTQGCLSDFGMSLLAYGLMFNQPSQLKTINLGNTPIKPGQNPYPKDLNSFIFPSYNGTLNLQLFKEFSRTALKTDEKSGLQLIIEALKKSTSITSINLSNCQLNDKMAKVLAASLQENRTLKKLALGMNVIKSKGIRVLSKAVGQHSSLETLILASNINIDKSGWIDFFSALAGNTSLRQLDLDACLIGDKEASALAAMLQKNRTLEKLILSNNQITVEGMTVLAKSLEGHPSINLLDLAGNYIPFKHLPMLEHLVSDGMQVRVTTDKQYKVAKANGTSLGTLPALNKFGELVKSDDVWLEKSW